MDRKTMLADPFVTLRVGSLSKCSTSIARKTLNPVWNELFRFEVVNDIALQDEPLELVVFDKDTYTADDAIGSVTIDLNPLLVRHSDANAGAASGCDSIAGLFPIYDSFAGIRGHLHVQIKLQVFLDSNPFKDSSAGVQFFAVSTLEGYVIEAIHGFVEELILEKDPENHWIDTFRASRTSNDARLKLFNVLSAKVTRNAGRKALELGGNAVVAFKQTFDLENELGIVARASGTAVTIRRVGAATTGAAQAAAAAAAAAASSASAAASSSAAGDSTLPALSIGGGVVTDAKASTASSAASSSAAGAASGAAVAGDEEEAKETIVIDAPEKVASAVLDPSIISSTLEQAQQALHPSSVALPTAVDARSALMSRHDYRREVHLLTMTSFPSSVQICLGGVVVARAVKLLDASRNPANQRAHDQWWLTLRKEIKSHARALNCTTVLGYTETVSIHDNVLVLTAAGTAARVGWFRPVRHAPASAAAAAMGAHHHASHRSTGTAATGSSSVPPHPGSSSASSRPGVAAAAAAAAAARSSARDYSLPHFSALKHHRRRQPPCAVVHVPYARDSSAFRASLRPCGMCGKRFVPEMCLSTSELYACSNASALPVGAQPTVRDQFPERDLMRVPIVGRGCLIEARVCRAKKRTSSEQSATEISQTLPFLEFETHRQLLYKLRVLGMNAVFGLRMQLVLGDNLMVAVATGTAVFMPALPPPPLLLIQRYIAVEDEEDRTLVDLQQKLMALSQTNRSYWLAMSKTWKREQKQKLRRMRRLQRQHAAQQAATQQAQTQALLLKAAGSTPPLNLVTIGAGGSPYHRGARLSPAVAPHTGGGAASQHHSSHSHGSMGSSGGGVLAHSARAAPRGAGHHTHPASATHLPRSLQLGGSPFPSGVPGAESGGSQLMSRHASAEASSSAEDSSLQLERQLSSSLDSYEASHTADSNSEHAPYPTPSPQQARTQMRMLQHAALGDEPTRAVQGSGADTNRPTDSVTNSGGADGHAPSDSHTSTVHASPAPPSLKHADSSPSLQMDGGAGGVGGVGVAAASGSSGEEEEASSSSDEDQGADDEEPDRALVEHFGDAHSEFVLQIDDEADEDLMSVLLEPTAPDHVFMCNTECLPGLQPMRIAGLEHLQQQHQHFHHNPQQGVRVLDDAARSQLWSAATASPHSPGKGGAGGAGGMDSNAGAGMASGLSSSSLPSPLHVSGGVATAAAAAAVISAQTSLPNVSLLTLVRRVEWEDDVGDSLNKHNKAAAQAKQNLAGGGRTPGGSGASAVRTPAGAGIGRKLTKEAAAQAAAADHDAASSAGTKVEAKLTGLNRLLSSIYHDLYAALCYKVQGFAFPCYLAAIRSRVHLPAENTVEVVMLALAVRQTVPLALRDLTHTGPTPADAAAALQRRLAGERSNQRRARKHSSGKGERTSGGGVGSSAKGMRGASSTPAAGVGTAAGPVHKTSGASSSSSLSSSSSSSSDDDVVAGAAPRALSTPVAARRASSSYIPSTSLAALLVGRERDESAAAAAAPAAEEALVLRRIASSEEPHHHHSHHSESPFARRGGYHAHAPQQATSQSTRALRTLQASVSGLLPPPLPPALQRVIDPSTHKAFGMPLFLPPLTLAAMETLRASVVRGLVEMNSLAGREVHSISGLKDLPASVALAMDSLALTPAVPSAQLAPLASAKYATDRGLTEFLLEHNTSAAALQASSVHSAAPTPSPAAAASALSILAAASIPQVRGASVPPSPAAATTDAASRATNEEKEQVADEQLYAPASSLAVPLSGVAGVAGVGSIRSPANLSISLPTAAHMSSSYPSPSPVTNTQGGHAPWMRNAAASEAGHSSTLSPQTSLESSLCESALGSGVGGAGGGCIGSAASLPSLPLNELLAVEFTPCSFIPHAHITHYLGRVVVHLIKEVSSYKDREGLGHFVQRFLTEANQLARAHVISRGGNALIGFTVQELMMQQQSEQAYAIISISGDAVMVEKASNSKEQGKKKA